MTTQPNVPESSKGDSQSSTVFLTVADVARQMKIIRATVYDWVSRRILPHVKVGRFVRIDPADFAEFLRLRRRGDFSSIRDGRTQTRPGRW